MSHTVRHKKMLLTRLKKIQGQSAALEKMLNREHECAEVLQQLAAIRGAAELLQGDMSREQQQRFEQDNRKRAARGLPQQPIDTNLLEALKVGMPDCSGVALGVDRLVMLALGAESLAEVIAFTVDRA